MKKKAVHPSSNKILPSEANSLRNLIGTRLIIPRKRVKAFDDYITKFDLNFTVANVKGVFMIIKLTKVIDGLDSYLVSSIGINMIPHKLVKESNSEKFKLFVEDVIVYDFIMADASIFETVQKAKEDRMVASLDRFHLNNSSLF